MHYQDLTELKLPGKHQNQKKNLTYSPDYPVHVTRGVAVAPT